MDSELKKVRDDITAHKENIAQRIVELKEKQSQNSWLPEKQKSTESNRKDVSSSNVSEITEPNTTAVSQTTNDSPPNITLSRNSAEQVATKRSEKSNDENEPMQGEITNKLKESTIGKQSAISTNMHLISKMNFQRLRDPLTKQSSFLVFYDRILSELKSHGAGFIVDAKLKPAMKFNDEEIQVLSDKVRNFIIQNISSDLHSQTRTWKEPKILLDKLEHAVDPHGVGADYELKKRFNQIMYDPRHESALEFNNRFDGLVERIRRRKQLPEQEEKENYLFAIEKYAKDIQTMEFTKFNHDKTGYSVADLKDLLISIESREKETNRREEENRDGPGNAMYSSGGKSRMNNGLVKPFTKPTCRCGYTPDNHTDENCPFPGLWYCYGCNMHTTHKRPDCPYDKKIKYQ